MTGELAPQDLLYSHEKVWTEFYPYLLKRGYKLRPRYSPDWIPSWGLKSRIPEFGEPEDSRPVPPSPAIDATVIQTGQKVIVKKGSIHEASIAMHLHSQVSHEGENKTVPIIDIFSVPGMDGEVFIVTMPMLRCFSDLPFRRVGEFLDAMHQFISGLVFMHKHNVAHRDACTYNLCMDASKMIPKGYHFADHFTHNGIRGSDFHWRPRSSVALVQYYFIDFDLSEQYPLEKKQVLAGGIVGQDRTVPEMSMTKLYDPFKMDIYQLGNSFKQVIEEYEGLEWAQPLLDAMTQQDPNARPTAAEALNSANKLLKTMSKKELRRRIWRKRTLQYFRFKIRHLGYNSYYW